MGAKAVSRMGAVNVEGSPTKYLLLESSGNECKWGNHMKQANREPSGRPSPQEAWVHSRLNCL